MRRRFVSSPTVLLITHAARAQGRGSAQYLATRCLRGFSIHADRRANDLWLEQPKPWRSELLFVEASRQGIAIPTSQPFMIADGHAPNAVRLALGLPSIANLEQALTTISGLLRDRPGSLYVDSTCRGGGPLPDIATVEADQKNGGGMGDDDPSRLAATLTITP